MDHTLLVRHARLAPLIVIATLAVLASPTTVAAQGGSPVASPPSRTSDSLAALALADSALAAISRGDLVALSDLMLPEGRTFSSREREGEWRYSSRTRDQERATRIVGTIRERGFGATALVSGPLAVVWMPYDLYINGGWSHCGVDAFTMYKVGGQWRIATLAWSVEQPPACATHPNGPPSA